MSKDTFFFKMSEFLLFLLIKKMWLQLHFRNRTFKYRRKTPIFRRKSKMPELPEVSYNKEYVDATSLHQEIAEVEAEDSRILQNSLQDFKTTLKGFSFTESKRVGKYLFLKLEEEDWLVLHFGMTGKLNYSNHEEPPKYTRFLIKFTNGSYLAFICPRKIGKIYLTESVEKFQKDHQLGTDVLELSKQDFLKLLEGKRGSIKGALMNQKLMAGLGNMYADEVLFQTGIHPKTAVDKLSEKENKKLFKTISKVLKVVIKSRTEDENLPENYLTPHRKDGDDCPCCAGKIKKIKVVGRSTYFCPNSQTLSE